LKAINATPKEVRKVFVDSYIIPDFQRRYSWEREQCETLWSDFAEFHEENSGGSSEEKYFLGNIVIHAVEGGKYAVIDGQQRLTTLLLLIKALHTRAGTVDALGGCLRIKDKLTDKLTEELRVHSEVIDSDADMLKKIIFDELEDTDTGNLAQNFRFYIDKIDEWRQEHGGDSGKFNAFILTLLDKVVLLPIECGSEDDALTIFETINNRGMSLSDADIFKAKLYHFVPKEKQTAFIEVWNRFENPDRLFRILMHILRADKKDTGKEIGLRAYFKSPENPLADWERIMSSLKKIHSVDKRWDTSGNWGAVHSLWGILGTYPNQYWNYPMYVFLHKYGGYSDREGFSLPEGHHDALEKLLTAMVQYYFLKGVVHNAVNTVRDTTFKACAEIAGGGDYLAEFAANVSASERSALSTKLQGNQLGRYSRGLVLLSAYLNPDQDKEKFGELLQERYDIEHILPREWNHYDGWNEQTHKEHLNYLGNLMPLERAKNIKAQNEYLRKKKEFYKTSVVQDALDMLNVPDAGWTPRKLQEIHLKKVSRLQDFFDCHSV
jgi:hypothetical protein